MKKAYIDLQKKRFIIHICIEKVENLSNSVLRGLVCASQIFHICISYWNSDKLLLHFAQVSTKLNKCSDRSMEVELPAIFRNNERLTYPQTDRQTDRRTGRITSLSCKFTK